MDKRNTKKEKLKRNKGFPYKSRVWINVNTIEKYIVLNKEGNELGRYRLKSTALQTHGKNVKIITIDEINTKQKGL